MQQTDFAQWLKSFFLAGLRYEKQASPETVDTYRYAFLQYLDYMEAKNGILPDQVAIKDFTATSVSGFIDWLEKEKGNGVPSCNLRLSALKSFGRYLTQHVPEFNEEFARIRKIPSRKASKEELSYLSKEGVELILKQVNPKTKSGLRDFLILLFLYTTGIRVSELIAIEVNDLDLQNPPSLNVRGSERKDRLVSIPNYVLPYLQDYLKRMRYESEAKAFEPLFKNHLNLPFTRNGINFIVKKYANLARNANPSLIPTEVSPQTFRNTMAMQMVESETPLSVVQANLGLKSSTATQVYVRANAKLQKDNPSSSTSNLPTSDPNRSET